MKLACWYCDTEHQIDDAHVPALDATITCRSCQREIVLPPPLMDDLPGIVGGGHAIEQPAGTESNRGDDLSATSFDPSVFAEDLPASAAAARATRIQEPVAANYDDLPQLDDQTEIPLIDDDNLIALESTSAPIGAPAESEAKMPSLSSEQSDLPSSVHETPTHEMTPLSAEYWSAGIGEQNELDDLPDVSDRPELSIVTAEYTFESRFHRPTQSLEVVDLSDEAPLDEEDEEPVASPEPEPEPPSSSVPRRGDGLAEAQEGEHASSLVDVVADDSNLGEKPPRRRPAVGLGAIAALIVVGLAVIGSQIDPGTLLSTRDGSPADDAHTQGTRAQLRPEAETVEGKSSDPGVEVASERNENPLDTRNNVDEPTGPPPQLTSSSVHSLSYGQLRHATTRYAEEAEHDRTLLSFARFRLAHTFGDPTATAALRASLPRRINLALIDSELELAGELGHLVVLNQNVQAKRLGERALKKAFRNSAVVEYVTGTSTQGAPPVGALKHFERAIELNSGLVDARMARAALLLNQAKRAGEALAVLEEVVRESPHPSTAVRAATILMKSKRFDAIELVDDPLLQADQADSVAPPQRDAFYRLLIAKHTRSAEFSEGAETARTWSQVAPKPEAFVAEARLVAAQGQDPEPGIRSALDEVNDARDRAELLYELGRLMLQGDKAAAANATQRAQQVLVELRSLPEDQAQTWAKLLEGDIAAAAKQSQQARSAYTESGRDRPNFVEPRLAALLIDQDKSGRTITKLTQLERRSGHPAVTQALADMKFTLGDFVGDVVEAAELYDKALWQTPPPRDPRRVVASWVKAHAESGDREGAYARLEVIHQARPEDIEFLSGLIDLAGSLERFDDQLRWQKKRLELSPDDPTERLRYAKTLNQVDRFTEAQAIIEQLHQSPKNRSAESLAELGRSLIATDEVAARALLNEAIRLESSAEVYSLLAEVEAKQQRYDEAIEYYQKALQLSDNDPSVGRKLGMLQLDRGRTRDAIDNLDLVFKLNPKDRQTALALGAALSSVGRHRDALQVYRKAGQNTAPDPEFMMRSAVIQLQHLDRTRPAMRLLRQVLELEPDSANARYYLGYALKDLGRNQEARGQLRSFLKATQDQELASEVSRDLEDLTP